MSSVSFNYSEWWCISSTYFCNLKHAMYVNHGYARIRFSTFFHEILQVFCVALLYCYVKHKYSLLSSFISAFVWNFMTLCLHLRYVAKDFVWQPRVQLSNSFFSELCSSKVRYLLSYNFVCAEHIALYYISL